MTDVPSNRSAYRSCEVCSSIPPDMWANTGRGESLYPELGQLVRLDLDSRNDLYVCPGCEALFEWEDLSQLSGSGNNDEERLTRLDLERESTARELLDPDPGERDCERLLDQAFRLLSYDVVLNILRYRARRRTEAFSGFVAPLVARLVAASHGGLFDVIGTYCGHDRERLTEVVRLLDAAGPDMSKSARYLRETCVDRLARVSTATDRERLSRDR